MALRPNWLDSVPKLVTRRIPDLGRVSMEGTLQPLKCSRNTDHLQVFRIGDLQSEPEFCTRFENLN